MTTFAIVEFDKNGSPKGTLGVVDDFEKAMEVAANAARTGAKTKVFKEQGEVILKATLVSTNGDTTPATKAPSPRPATNGVVRRAVHIRPAGVKRSADDMDKVRTKILSWLVTNPGKGAEDISRALNVETGDLALPIRQLLAEKKLTRKGQARWSKYTVSKNGSAKKDA